MLSVVRPNVGKLIQDGAGVLKPADVDFHIGEAVNRYSRAMPRLVVADVAGTGAFDYALPAPWSDLFSAIAFVEYPAGQREPTFVDRLDWTLYRLPASLVLRFLTDTPKVGETIRLTFTAPHTMVENSTTVPASDFPVINALAAALCCESLASHYSNVGDNTIAADSVDHRSKAQEYAARAKRFMALADGLLPQLKQDCEVRAAGAATSWGEGEGFLTHPER
ncbi:MAG: hypothetical protein ACREMA_02260 [Longimicrobiales bacterium]